jgi:hypothetical protein
MRLELTYDPWSRTLTAAPADHDMSAWLFEAEAGADRRRHLLDMLVAIQPMSGGGWSMPLFMYAAFLENQLATQYPGTGIVVVGC